jgi:hypothetical protein
MCVSERRILVGQVKDAEILQAAYYFLLMGSLSETSRVRTSTVVAKTARARERVRDNIKPSSAFCGINYSSNFHIFIALQF